MWICWVWPCCQSHALDKPGGLPVDQHLAHVCSCPEPSIPSAWKALPSWSSSWTRAHPGLSKSNASSLLDSLSQNWAPLSWPQEVFGLYFQFCSFHRLARGSTCFRLSYPLASVGFEAGVVCWSACDPHSTLASAHPESADGLDHSNKCWLKMKKSETPHLGL